VEEAVTLPKWLILGVYLSLLPAADNRKPLLQRAPLKEAGRTNPFDGQEPAGRAGRKLYERECSSCHGASAQGAHGAPALASPALRTAPPGVIFWVLRNGSLRRGMPPFSHLPEQQRWQIVTYLKTL
jgi:mono/diheme cytochrome c family protein